MPNHDWSDSQVPARKQTSLGLYVSAAEAYEMWKADSENVHIIDVRLPEEYVFVGHPEMARNIPLAFMTYEGWDFEADDPTSRVNAEFMPRMTRMFKPDDTLVMMCRSGARSALAVNALAKAGFTNVYNMIDGFEGDKIKDPESSYHGKRMKNGWVNSGSPWTYECDTELMWIVSQQ